MAERFVDQIFSNHTPDELDEIGLPASEILMRYIEGGVQERYASPMSLTEFHHERGLAFDELFKMCASDVGGSYNDSLLKLVYFETAGFIVPREVDYYYENSTDYWEYEQVKQEGVQLMDHLSNHGAVKTVGLDMKEAIASMDTATKEGERIVVLLGGFDLPHIGHSALFDEARLVAGRFGKVFGFVDSNLALRTKGEDRPYMSQDERVGTLLESNLVDFVSPLPEPQTSDLSQIIELYESFARKAKFHFRLVGSDVKPELMELYRKQCGLSGGLLIYSDNERIASTTSYADTVARKLS